MFCHMFLVETPCANGSTLHQVEKVFAPVFNAYIACMRRRSKFLNLCPILIALCCNKNMFKAKCLYYVQYKVCALGQIVDEITNLPLSFYKFLGGMDSHSLPQSEFNPDYF